jgi:hypothetical protein
VKAALLALALAGCATPMAHTAPEPPRLRCINYGQVPGSQWFIYACTFTGEPESEPPAPAAIPFSLGES